MTDKDKPRQGDEREAKPGELRDQQTRRAVEQAERAEDKREGTADKHRRLRREATAGRYGREGGEAEGREGEEPEYEPGPDGTVHLMQEEMIAAAMDRDAPEEQEAQPRVVHLEELRMKGEAIEDYLSEADRPDNTLPEEPLPGKPPEPPLGGSRSGNERKPEPVQYPAGKQRR